jgi:integrase
MKLRKHAPWNKGRGLGTKRPFSPADVERIRKQLATRGDAGLRDLAAFSTAIDTMLRAPDLLGLRVKDVRKRNRVMRDTIDLAMDHRGQELRCTLSAPTMNVLEAWIEHSTKKPGDYLFTKRGARGLEPISPRQFSRLVKTWVDDIGLDASQYGLESLRRTRSVYILNQTGNMEAVRVLLGLNDIASTARYLGPSNPMDALLVSRSYEI